MRLAPPALVLLLALSCGDDTSDGASSTEGSTSTGDSTTTDGSAESMQPCESADSRFTVFLADSRLTEFVLTIDYGNPPTTVTCPSAAIEGSFASYAECGAGEVTLFEPHDFPAILVRIAVDDGPLETVVIDCQNTSTCPKQGRNACEVQLGDEASTSSST